MARASAVQLSEEPARLRRIVTYETFAEALGCHRATIFRLTKSDPSCPKPVRVGNFATGFYEDEVAAYINNLPLAADKPVHHGGKVHLKAKRKRAA